MQGALTWEGGATAGGEQAETVVEAAGDLVDRHGAEFGGGQFQRQRDAVQAAADFGDGAEGAVVEGEVRTDGGGAVEEETHGRSRLCGIEFRRFARQRERAEVAEGFSGDGQRFPGGREN